MSKTSPINRVPRNAVLADLVSVESRSCGVTAVVGIRRMIEVFEP